jgi:predicted phosphohydrolase
MKLFAIGELHLSLSVNKPMDIFGSAGQIIWKNWKILAERGKAEDTVVVLRRRILGDQF